MLVLGQARGLLDRTLAVLEGAKGPTTVRRLLFDTEKVTTEQAREWGKRCGLESIEAVAVDGGMAVQAPGEFEGAEPIDLGPGVKVELGVLKESIGKEKPKPGAALRTMGLLEAILYPVLSVPTKGPVTVQAVVCYKYEYSGPSSPKYFAQDYGFSAERIEVHEDHFAVVQKPESDFDPAGIAGEQFAEVKVMNGTYLRVGVLKSDVPATESGDKPADAPAAPTAAAGDVPLFESIDGDTICLSGPVLLEGGQVKARAIFEATGRLPFKIPFMKIGAVTANNKRYVEECAGHLERDISRMQISTESSKKLQIKNNSPWPAMAMFPSHGPARRILEGGGEGAENFLSLCGKVLGTYREDGVLGARCETLPTSAGKDMAILALEGMVAGGSLRAFPKDQVATESGVTDVKRLRVETFGIDFTQMPAMPGAELQLESGAQSDQPAAEQETTLPMTKEQLMALKTSDPAAYKVLMETLGADQNAEIRAELEAERGRTRANRIAIAEGRGQAVIDKWGKTFLESEKALSADVKKSIMAEALPLAAAACKALAESDANIDVTSDTFATAVLSNLESQLAGRIGAVKALVAAELKARNIVDAPDLENAELAPEGNEGLMEGQAPGQIERKLDSRMLLIESEREIVGLPREYRKNGSAPAPKPVELSDVLLAEAIGMPIYEENEAGNYRHLMDIHMPGRRALARKMSKVYESAPGHLWQNVPGMSQWNDKTMASHPVLGKVLHKIKNRIPLEADEMTVANTLGALLPDVRKTVIEFGIAMAKWLTLAQVRPQTSPKYKVYDEQYRRAGENQFGELAQAGLTGTDNGALTVADNAYVRIAVLYDADETITVVGTNTLGQAITGTVNVYTTDAVGATRKIRPTRTGDKFKDISAATDTDTASAGKVIIYAPKPLTGGTELAVSQKGRGSVVPIEGECDEFTIESELTWRTIEDANNSVTTLGIDRYDAAVRTIRMLGLDFKDTIDAVGFHALFASANRDTTNDRVLDMNNAPMSRLHRELTRLALGIAGWNERGERPDFLVMNEGNLEFMHDMKEDFITRFERRAEAFFGGQVWGTIAGMQVIDTQHAPAFGLMACVSGRIQHASYIPLQFYGPYGYLDHQMTDTYVGRNRSTNVLTQPETRGMLEVKNWTNETGL